MTKLNPLANIAIQNLDFYFWNTNLLNQLIKYDNFDFQIYSIKSLYSSCRFGLNSLIVGSNYSN